MKYRGYMITHTFEEDRQRVRCDIYRLEDEEHLDALDTWFLRIGDHIPDTTDQSISAAIRNYVDEWHLNFRAISAEISNYRKNKIIINLVNLLGQHMTHADIYKILHGNIGMSDAEMQDAGLTFLEPYYDRDKYAKVIANFMSMAGSEATPSGCWEFLYRQLNDRYGTNLPQDSDLMKRIQSHLCEDHSETVAGITVNDYCFILRYNPEQCPDLDRNTHHAEDNNPGIMPTM